MLMYITQAAFFLGLMALASGAFLFSWSTRNTGFEARFAKFLAVLIILFTIADGAILGYYTTNYWKAGYFEVPNTGMTTNDKPPNRPRSRR